MLDIKTNDVYMEKATHLFFIVTNSSPLVTKVLFDLDTKDISVIECIQHPLVKSTHSFSYRPVKVYLDLLDLNRFTPIRLNNVIIDEDLFNKFLEALIKGDT